MNISKHKIFIFSPHTDDAELACGGSINRWVNEGRDVHVVTYSCGSALKKEFVEATKILGLKRKNIELLKYPVRRFPEFRQRILEGMVDIERRERPDLVLIPSSADIHQDHGVIRNEGFRAFKRTSLLGYEMPQNNLSFNTNLIVKLSEENMQNKIKAVKAYESQMQRSYVTGDYIRGLANVRGMQGGFNLAEAYEMIRWIV